MSGCGPEGRSMQFRASFRPPVRAEGAAKGCAFSVLYLKGLEGGDQHVQSQVEFQPAHQQRVRQVVLRAQPQAPVRGWGVGRKGGAAADTRPRKRLSLPRNAYPVPFTAHTGPEKFLSPSHDSFAKL
eukprot:SAG11_NODE_19652_length_462_cov_0.534435_1_plen_126_part_10